VTQLTWQQRVLYGLTNWGLLLAGLVNLVVGTWSALHQSSSIAAVSLTAGLVLIFAATIDRFESLKGLGIEAKTKKLDEKIEQADEALQRLKELAELTGATLIDLNSKVGRLDSAPTVSQSYALAQKTRLILERLGSKPENIRAILNPFVLRMCRDLTFATIRPLYKALQQEAINLAAERAALHQHPVHADDPNLLRLIAANEAVHKYRDHRLSKLPDDLYRYPDVLLGIIDDAPIADKGVVDACRTKAMRLVPVMRSLCENFTIPDPDPWFREIDVAMRGPS